MSRITEDEIVLGMLVVFTAWYLIGLPILYMSEIGDRGSEMQSTNWIAVLVGFLGGSVFSSILGAVYAWWSRPILSVRFVPRKGCYVTTSRGDPATHQARYLRLIVENVGRSGVKGCVGYIVSIRKIVDGVPQSFEQEVLEVTW